MAQHDDARADSPDQALRLPTSESRAWVDGIFAGLSGAAVIAVFFLAVDLAAGAPLWTPGALGAALFLGRVLEPGAEPVMALVFGYTVLHGVMFVTAGVVASVALIGRQKALGPLSGLGLAAALFAGLDLFFVALVSLAAPSLIAEFGVGRIATANLLAAGIMSVVLLRPRHEPVSMVGRPLAVGVSIALALTTVFMVRWLAGAYISAAS